MNNTTRTEPLVDTTGRVMIAISSIALLATAVYFLIGSDARTGWPFIALAILIMLFLIPRKVVDDK